MLLSANKTQMASEAAKSMEESADLVKQTLDGFVSWLIQKSGSVLVAALFIFIGLKVVGFFLKVLNRSFERAKMEASVAGFLLSVIRVLCYVLVFISAAAILGIEVTSFVTILGTASLAIGLALQGALSNLAGGVLILLLKPFQVGDYIIENNKNNEGTVVSVDIFYTRLRTHDNRIIVIPNGILADNSLVNLTDEAKRKLEIKIDIAYHTDMEKVKKIVRSLLQEEPMILQNEPMDIFIDAFEDSGMKLGIRAWVKTEDFWTATWKLREQVKTAFDLERIVIPYNRLEVDVRTTDSYKVGDDN